MPSTSTRSRLHDLFVAWPHLDTEDQLRAHALETVPAGMIAGERVAATGGKSLDPFNATMAQQKRRDAALQFTHWLVRFTDTQRYYEQQHDREHGSVMAALRVRFAVDVVERREAA